MQVEELPVNLLDPYDVLFFSRTQEVFSSDEMFEDTEYDSNADTIELINEMDTISLNNDNQIELNNTERNVISEKKAKISVQLPTPPDFDYFKYNVPFHK
ncbi:3227_t:CDS:2, partial [Racocetra fulgida]